MTGQAAFISVFMEVNNVHVNRMLFNDTVREMVHVLGIHLRGWKKESDLNERVTVKIGDPVYAVVTTVAKPVG